MTEALLMSLTDTVTHVLVGYGAWILPELEERLPERSVLILEEPSVIAARGAQELAARFRCVAALIEAPTQDEEHPERLVAALPRPQNVRAVIPAVEYAVVAAAALADSWGLPGAGLPAARVFRDKARLRTVADEAGIPQPRWASVHGPDAVERFRAEHGAACVIKPANRQASLGVQLLEPEDDAHALWEHTAGASESRQRAPYEGADRYLVEQRVYGPEVSVEALVHQGVVGFRNVTAKTVQGSRHPVELAHAVPAALPAATEAALHDAVQQLATAAGFQDGVLHAEWILGDGGPYLVECAARLPGDGISVLISLAYGGNFVADLLGLLEGHGPVPSRDPVAGAAVRFLSAAPGLVEAVQGEEEARQAKGVHQVQLAVAAGDTVKPTTSSWERAGQIIAIGADGPEAAANALAAADRITVRSVEAPAPASGSAPAASEADRSGDAPAPAPTEGDRS
ncbi:ATP-grasp domain-containing protein [Streptomyces sp. LMG1-1-1.1]